MWEIQATPGAATPLLVNAILRAGAPATIGTICLGNTASGDASTLLLSPGEGGSAILRLRVFSLPTARTCSNTTSSRQPERGPRGVYPRSTDDYALADALGWPPHFISPAARSTTDRRIGPLFDRRTSASVIADKAYDSNDFQHIIAKAAWWPLFRSMDHSFLRTIASVAIL
jgi:hypothetical protein